MLQRVDERRDTWPRPFDHRLPCEGRRGRPFFVTMDMDADHRDAFLVGTPHFPLSAIGPHCVAANQGNNPIAAADFRPATRFPVPVSRLFNRHVHELERAVVVSGMPDQKIPGPFILDRETHEYAVARGHVLGLCGRSDSWRLPVYLGGEKKALAGAVGAVRGRTC